jgi:hypothetical protein
LVNADGSTTVTSVSPGVTVTVSHTATGQYALSATGLGPYPLPTLTSVGAGWEGLYYNGGSTGSDGSLTTTVFTSDGQDHAWSFEVSAPAPTSNGAAANGANARTSSRITLKSIH